MLFETLMSVKTARKKFTEAVKKTFKPEAELVDLEKAHLRVLAEDLHSEIDIPHYNRAAMDGYAVRSQDVAMAGRNNPVVLRKGKEALWVHTGDSVPSGYDAVVKVEDTEDFGEYVAIYKSVGKLENMGIAGEDVRRGDVIVERGTLLRAHHLALIRSAGIEEIMVYRKPRILVVPTGDELLKPGEKLIEGKVYESNGIMVSSYLREWGADVDVSEIIPDNPSDIKRTLENAERYDMIVTTGGTSVGKRDVIYGVLKEIGELIFRGVSLRPGKPTVSAIVNEKPLLALPGFPAACVASAYTFLKPALKHVFNQNDEVSFNAILTEKIYSKPGFTSFVRLKVDYQSMEATPISSYGSGILTSVTKANCYTYVDEDIEFVERGEEIRVFPL